MDDYSDAPEDEVAAEPQQAAQQDISPAQKLEIIMKEPNIAAVLPEQTLSEISSKVVDEYRIDKASRKDWEERIDGALDLAMMVAATKSYPFEGAANIKYPLLTVAALQFNARAYPAVVQGNRVAKCQTWGHDQQGLKAARAERVSEHLSFQLLSELPEWEGDTDKLLVILPIVGCAFRKVWWDPALKRNRTRLIQASSLVVNYFARSMEDVPRLTEEMQLYPYEIQERIRGGRFIEFDYKNSGPTVEDSDRKDKQQPVDGDDDAPQMFLEQHRLLDLDEDGYPEPYIVTVHLATSKVCRIVANFGPESVVMGDDGEISAIRRNEYYVAYQFLPSPDGGFYGWGFGWLLKDIGESINSTLNQMLDAGHLSNVQGGFVSSQLGIKEKTVRLKMGEWKVLNTSGPISQAIMPITYPGPSAVLFNLLGTLIESGKEVASIKDVLTGDTPATAPVGTTLAIIEQGLQVFTSIYKRVHRAIKAELGLHAKLNRNHLSPEKYAKFFDGEQVDPKADYNEDDMDILPVSDPNSVSKMQRLAKAQLIRDVAKENPTVNQYEATRRVLEAADIEDIEKLILPPPEPNPEDEFLKRLVAMLQLDQIEAEVLKTKTAAIKNIADAEAAEAGPQVQAYIGYLNGLSKMMGGANGDGQGRVPGMEGQPGNAAGAQPLQIEGGGPGIPASGAPLPLMGPDPGGMGGAPVPGGL